MVGGAIRRMLNQKLSMTWEKWQYEAAEMKRQQQLSPHVGVFATSPSPEVHVCRAPCARNARVLGSHLACFNLLALQHNLNAMRNDEPAPHLNVLPPQLRWW